MGEKKTWKDQLMELIGKPGDKVHKNRSKYQYFLLVLGIGLVCMLAGNLFLGGQSKDAAAPALNPVTNEKEVFKQDQNSDSGLIKNYEKEYENQLKEALDNIAGVDDVTVLVNVDASSMKILEKNRTSQDQTTDETDKEGGKRNVEDQSSEEQTVIVKSGDKESPIVLQEKKPEIRGVLVVAKGANNVQIKQTIIEAVTRALGVPSHRVAVLPKKIKGDS
ncbi:stage III sporulation protein AG [Metabacillus sp. RGM 3146]|uniref:stage III sporulation protein AG n=1 Tax=Metabacillus sp. RGM 3146 TaxID=3401092 RepID=UPI003B9D37F8